MGILGKITVYNPDVDVYEEIIIEDEAMLAVFGADISGVEPIEEGEQ